MNPRTCLIPLLLLTTAVAPADEAPETAVFIGMCDASAAAAIDARHFVVADDEDNILRVYSRRGGAAVSEHDVSAFLETGGKKKPKEADLEGGTQIGTRTFWITSHGRNSKGKETPERQRLFATETKFVDGRANIEPVGKPYAQLLDDLLSDPRLARYRLAEAAALAPKSPGALNIEGLAGTPGGHLLIGFRNPIRDGKTLVVPILNPQDVVEGARATLGPPQELALDGLGIRSIDFWNGRYLIIAGSYDEGGTSRLYTWDGRAQPQRIAAVSFAQLNPEGMVFQRPDGTSEFFVLSDDGSQQVEGKDCKKLKDPTLKRFRGSVLRLPAAPSN